MTPRALNTWCTHKRECENTLRKQYKKKSFQLCVLQSCVMCIGKWCTLIGTGTCLETSSLAAWISFVPTHKFMVFLNWAHCAATWHGYWPPWVLATMGTAHHGVTLVIMGHIIVTMGDIKWMGRLTAANSMYDLANYKGTSSLAACISSVSTNFYYGTYYCYHMGVGLSTLC